NCQTKRLCSAQVDHEFELVRLLDRKISRLEALQNLVNICRRVTSGHREVGRIAEQPTGDDVLTPCIRHGKPDALHQGLQAGALVEIERVGDYDDSLRVLPNDLADGGAEFRLRVGDDAQGSEIQRGAGALG